MSQAHIHSFIIPFASLVQYLVVLLVHPLAQCYDDTLPTATIQMLLLLIKRVSSLAVHIVECLLMQ